MHKIASAEIDDFAFKYYAGNSFKRRRFKTKRHESNIKKLESSNSHAYLTSFTQDKKSDSPKFSYSLLNGVRLVKSVEDISDVHSCYFLDEKELRRIRFSELPIDGFFGLANVGIQYRIEGMIAYEADKIFDPVKKVDFVRRHLLNEYELVEVNHLRNLLEIEYDAKHKNYDDVNNNSSKRKFGIHFLKKFLYCEVVSNILDYAQVDGAEGKADYHNERERNKSRQSLPLAEPLAIASAAYSQIPGPLMTEVLCVWHFFHQFATFLGRINLSLSDTCLACIAPSCEDACPSLHKTLYYDEMATCLTRILFLDTRNDCAAFSNDDDDLWNEMTSHFTLNTITWPEVAHWCILFKLYAEPLSSTKSLNETATFRTLTIYEQYGIDYPANVSESILVRISISVIDFG